VPQTASIPERKYVAAEKEMPNPVAAATYAMTHAGHFGTKANAMPESTDAMRLKCRRNADFLGAAAGFASCGDADVRASQQQDEVGSTFVSRSRMVAHISISPSGEWLAGSANLSMSATGNRTLTIRTSREQIVNFQVFPSTDR